MSPAEKILLVVLCAGIIISLVHAVLATTIDADRDEETQRILAEQDEDA